MTEEEYHTLERLSPDRKYEYINGVAYMMSGGSVAHDRIRRNVEFALDSMLRSVSCSVFGPDVQVMIGFRKNSTPQYLYPDTTISCDPRDSELDNLLVEHPRVVVEVLSPGTEAKDRGTKFRHYQLWPTVQEIVLVNQFAPLVEVWQRNEDDPDNVKAWLYRRSGPGDVVELASIDVRVAIEAFYRGLTFDDGEEERSSV
jgi:Uma2 family endonuclease